MSRLQQTFNCPVISPSGTGGGLIKSDSVYCPILYCPSAENGRDNYTVSICVDYTASSSSNSVHENFCFTDVCGRSCDVLKSNDVTKVVTAERKPYYTGVNNYDVSISVGCRNGDFRGVENQTVVLPNSTMETFTGKINFDTSNSSSNHLHTNLFIPFLVVIVLMLTNSQFPKKFSFE